MRSILHTWIGIVFRSFSGSKELRPQKNKCSGGTQAGRAFSHLPAAAAVALSPIGKLSEWENLESVAVLEHLLLCPTAAQTSATEWRQMASS